MKLHLGRQARRQVERKESWWADNRRVVPDLFARELLETLELVRAAPGSGVRWPTPRRPTLRRILMSRTQNHLYFVVDEEKSTIEVLAIWGAARARSPRL